MTRLSQKLVKLFCSIGRYRRSTRKLSICILQCLVVASICWFLASSLWLTPHSLSYASEWVGGPLFVSNHLLGNSGGDCGQDLRYLMWWLKEEGTKFEQKNLCLAYFGSFSPADVGFREASPLLLSESRLAVAKTIAISINLLHGSGALMSRDGKPGASIVPIGLREWLLQLNPTKHVGYSIVLYGNEGV